MNETNKASSGSDREVLTRVLHACILSIDETKAAQAADLCLAAGFTRAHHDGERVDEHDLDTTSVLGAMRGFVGAHTRPDGSHAKDVSMRLRPSTVWSVLAIVDRLTAEPDALAAMLSEAERACGTLGDRMFLVVKERDAAVARAEAAEAKLDSTYGKGLASAVPIVGAMGKAARTERERAEQAEERAAALAEALCKVAKLAPDSRRIEVAEAIATAALEADRAAIAATAAPVPTDDDHVCRGCGTPWGMRHSETCTNAAIPRRDAQR